MKTTRRCVVSLLAVLAVALVMAAGASAQDAVQVRFTNNTGVVAYDLHGLVSGTGNQLVAEIVDDPIGPPFPPNTAAYGNEFTFVWPGPPGAGIQPGQSVEVALSVADFGPLELVSAYWTDAAGNEIPGGVGEYEWRLVGSFCDLFYTPPADADTSVVVPPPPHELPPYGTSWGWPSPPWLRAGHSSDPQFPVWNMTVAPGKMVVIGHQNLYVEEWIKWIVIRVAYRGPQIVVVGPYVGYPSVGGPPGGVPESVVKHESDRYNPNTGNRVYHLDCWVDPQPSWEYFKIKNPQVAGSEDVEIVSVSFTTSCGPTAVEDTSWGAIKAMFR